MPEPWLVDDVPRIVLVFRRSAADVTYYDAALELAAQDTLTSPLHRGFELALSQPFEL